MPAHIELDPVSNNQERIDYLKMILDNDSKKLEIIDTHRHKNLAHALITFAAAFGATLKFLPDANPCLVGISLFFLATCFFLRDLQLHRYEHGWNGTIKEHLKKLEFIINNPKEKVDFYSYYKDEEWYAFRPKEFVSFNRWVYYLLAAGAIGAWIILAKDWIR